METKNLEKSEKKEQPKPFVPDYKLRAEILFGSIEIPDIKDESEFLDFFRSLIERAQQEIVLVEKLKTIDQNRADESIENFVLLANAPEKQKAFFTALQEEMNKHRPRRPGLRRPHCPKCGGVVVGIVRPKCTKCGELYRAPRR